MWDESFQVSQPSGCMRTLLVNCGEVAHLSVGNLESPLSGVQLEDRDQLVHLSGMSILIEDGLIERIGPTTDLVAEFAPWFPGLDKSAETEVIDVGGKAVVPGFVDCHTHLVWAGDRAEELALRLAGKTYRDIAAAGGGISKTVVHTRGAPIEALVESGSRRILSAVSNGTTAVEAKSGYGLDVDSEVKILEAISMIDRASPCNITPTWLGAHDLPPDSTRSDYVDQLTSDQLPIISELGLAKWADVFCEPGWFTPEETEEIVRAAADHDIGSRLHVDEFVDSGGLALATELGSASGDHVAYSNDESRHSAADGGTMQTFLPGTPYILGTDIVSLPIGKCIEEGWAFSTATDFNPNCPIISLPFIGSLLSHRLGIDPIASLISVTRNPATTLFGEAEMRGVLAEGKPADLNVLWSSSADSWCQTPGSTPVSMTMIGGEVVNSNKVY
ncbi:MAG: imidazolonepropionase [Euryarchaeota archaeon]|nr:imidazolonepropionase [Euryarchaeota archaeon]MBV43906.1 imidazolonepropionase [Euryarchaeota archaeon]